MSMNYDLRITEEPSRDGSGKPTTLFYIREYPFTPGRSIQATALTQEAAEWQRGVILRSITLRDQRIRELT